ncbi:MAG: hypothetical protein V1778_01480 [bacterium]
MCADVHPPQRVVDIIVGKLSPGWEEIVREHGHDPKNGFTDLEADGQYHWHPYPTDPEEEARLRQEQDCWDG